MVERVAGPPADADFVNGRDARLTGLMTPYMMAVLPGRERTLVELTDLLRVAGFTMQSLRQIVDQKCS